MIISQFSHWSPFIKTPEVFKEDYNNSIQPFYQDAAKRVKPFVSDDLFKNMESSVELNDLSPEESRLLPYIRRAIARFMLHIASPSLDVSLSSSGYQTNDNGNMAIASKDRVKKFDESIEKLAWNAIEVMLQFLEENKDDYPDWVNSDAYTMHIRNMINTAIKFDSIIPIDASRLTFMMVRPALDRADILHIIPEISQALFDTIINEIKSNNLSEPTKEIYPSLCNAEAFFAWSDYKRAKDQPHESFENYGKQFIAMVKKHIDNNPEKYPDYINSEYYRGEDPDYEHYKNDEDSGFFIAGSSPIT